MSEPIAQEVEEEKPTTYDMKRCHILGRRDLKAHARTLPLDKIKMHHVLPSALNHLERDRAHLVMVKVSSNESVTLKDILAEE